jgi:hypothetical protein
MSIMRWSVALAVGTALTLCLSGCRHCDKVEAELRARESDVQVLREQLDRAEFSNHSLLRELCALRGMPGPSGVIEAPTPPYPVRTLVLGRQTGGRPSDILPADDALCVLVEPRDCDGQALKAPGALFVEAHEVTVEGLKKPLSTWEVPPQALSGTWQNGLLTTGYLITLPWKVWPATEKVRIIARFQMLDGRIFEADKDVAIRILPEQQRKQFPPPGAAIVPAPQTTPIPFQPKEVEPRPVLPAPLPPAEVLPPPTPVPEEGPKLMHGRQSARSKVELLRPVPLPPEP